MHSEELTLVYQTKISSFGNAPHCGNALVNRMWQLGLKMCSTCLYLSWPSSLSLFLLLNVSLQFQTNSVKCAFIVNPLYIHNNKLIMIYQERRNEKKSKQKCWLEWFLSAIIRHLKMWLVPATFAQLQKRKNNYQSSYTTDITPFFLICSVFFILFFSHWGLFDLDWGNNHNHC